MAKKFVLGVAALTASRIFLALSQVIALPVIARFLSVEDFAAMALAMTVVLFSQILSDAGIGRSLIRAKTADHTEWSSVFWILLGVGVALFALLQLIAPLWARLFDLPALEDYVRVLALAPALSSVAALSNATLERDDRFAVLAGIRALAAAAGIVTAIWMAIDGFGAWALVAQQVAVAALLCVLSFLRSGFRPGLRFSNRGIGKHLRFARDNLGVAVLFTGQRQAVPIIIGYLLGAVPLGLFSMGQRILNLPLTALSGPVSQVSYVRMARVQNDPAKVGVLYVAALRLLACLIIPGMAVVAAAGGWLFPFVLSERWAPVAVIFALAAPGFALEACIGPAGVLYQALGRTGLRLRMATERALLRTLTILAATPFGIEAVAMVISAFALVYLPRAWHFAHKAAPFDRLEALGALALPSFFSALAWVALIMIEARYSPSLPVSAAAALGVLILTYILIGASQLRALRGALYQFKT